MAETVMLRPRCLVSGPCGPKAFDAGNSQAATAELALGVAWREESFGQRLKFGLPGGKF